MTSHNALSKEKGARLSFVCFFCLMFFCFWLFIGVPCFFVCSFHFPAFSSQFSVLSLVFHLFSLFFLHVPSPQVSSVLFCFSSPVFLYFPFILLPFLLGFQCFLRFWGLFLSIRYTFCIVLLYSVYIAASQIASVSSILRLFLSILLSCLAISKSFSFNWLYVGLILMHFVQVLQRFNVFI